MHGGVLIAGSLLIFKLTSCFEGNFSEIFLALRLADLYKVQCVSR